MLAIPDSQIKKISIFFLLLLFFFCLVFLEEKDKIVMPKASGRVNHGRLPKKMMIYESGLDYKTTMNI